MSDAVSREEFAALQAEVRALKESIEALTQRLGSSEDGVPDEVIAVIGAVVAAYLGKRATIKFVRRAGQDPTAWRLQGRATVPGTARRPQMRGW